MVKQTRTVRFSVGLQRVKKLFGAQLHQSKYLETDSMRHQSCLSVSTTLSFKIYDVVT